MNNRTLNFIDIKITKNNNEFEALIYRKSTFTGLTMNFNSFALFLYKTNLIKTLIYRAFNICSTFINFHVEILKINEALRNNLKTNNDFILKSDKLKLYFKIPYMGNESFTIRKNIVKLIKKYYPQIKLNIIFTNNFNINNFFRFKDQVPNSLRSCVVYKYNCDSCNATYVGKITRHFSTRISEHLGISHRSGIRLTSPPFSAIRNHVQYEKRPPPKL